MRVLNGDGFECTKEEVEHRDGVLYCAGMRCSIWRVSRAFGVVHGLSLVLSVSLDSLSSDVRWMSASVVGCHYYITPINVQSTKFQEYLYILDITRYMFPSTELRNTQSILSIDRYVSQHLNTGPLAKLIKSTYNDPLAIDRSIDLVRRISAQPALELTALSGSAI